MTSIECRMYEARYPEVDQAVMIQVKSMADSGAYVSLLEYNIEGMILFSELSRRRIRSISSLIKVGRIEPVMVLRVNKEKGYIDLSKRRVSEEDIQACEERYNKSKLVHSVMRHVAETLSLDLEDLYIHVGWPLYRKYVHAFEAFKLIVNDPDSILDSLTREVKEVGPDGEEVKKVAPAITDEVKDALVKNIRRRMTPQPLKIRADIEMKCFQFDGVLHIKVAMRRAESAGNKDCPVKIKLVAPPAYVLNTQTLDKFSSMGSDEGERLVQEVNPVITQDITQDLNSKLTAPIGDDEIKAALFSINPRKSPGIDESIKSARKPPILFREAMEAATQIVLLMLLFIATAVPLSVSGENFDVRRHLSTVTRYQVAKDISENSYIPSTIPDQCRPVHLNLVARHGTRAPTKKKMKELDSLSTRLEVLLENMKEQSVSVVPAWLRGWKSPWTGKHKGGELISEGENELYELGIRTRERFPELFNEDYHPDIYPIKATQISRASASAVAFGLGLFSGRGNLGPGYNRAFAVTSESRASDIMLRFHDCCQNYKAFRKSQAPFVDKLKEPVLDEITQALVMRWGLNFTRKDVSLLWFLCKQEASLLNTTDQACALFTPDEVGLLEWTDDLEVFVLKGYGNSLNYRMGVPLLEDVINSMEQAIKDTKDGRVHGSYELARLRFAHAETLLPFSCLIGLFLDGMDFEQILSEKTLNLPVKPPQKRIWRGSTVAPFAGNNMLVLYSCPTNNKSEYFVQVLHNEHPIPMAGCGNSDFCPFKMFKEKIVAVHLKHNYESLCSLETAQSGQVSAISKFFSKIGSWIFSSNVGQAQKTEL